MMTYYVSADRNIAETEEFKNKKQKHTTIYYIYVMLALFPRYCKGQFFSLCQRLKKSPSIVILYKLVL